MLRHLLKSYMRPYKRSRNKIIDPGKLFVSFLSLIVVISIIGSWANDKIQLDFAISNTSTISLQTLTIHSGDTLWSIAAKSLADNEDIREKVIQIRNFNGLSATQIVVPGQIIQIPVKSSNTEYMFANIRR